MYNSYEYSTIRTGMNENGQQFSPGDQLFVIVIEHQSSLSTTELFLGELRNIIVSFKWESLTYNRKERHYTNYFQYFVKTKCYH